MSFSKTPIKRFNEAVGCAPPSTKYTPKSHLSDNHALKFGDMLGRDQEVGLDGKDGVFTVPLLASGRGRKALRKVSKAKHRSHSRTRSASLSKSIEKVTKRRSQSVDRDNFGANGDGIDRMEVTDEHEVKSHPKLEISQNSVQVCDQTPQDLVAKLTEEEEASLQLKLEETTTSDFNNEDKLQQKLEEEPAAASDFRNEALIFQMQQKLDQQEYEIHSLALEICENQALLSEKDHTVQDLSWQNRKLSKLTEVQEKEMKELQKELTLLQKQEMKLKADGFTSKDRIKKLQEELERREVQLTFAQRNSQFKIKKMEEKAAENAATIQKLRRELDQRKCIQDIGMISLGLMACFGIFRTLMNRFS